MSIPAMIGGLLVGALASSFMGGKNQGYGGNYGGGAINYSPSTAIPSVPKPPTVEGGEDEGDAAAAIREAEEKEKAAAAARQKGGQDVFTSPLGVVGQANTNRKQLLGA